MTTTDLLNGAPNALQDAAKNHLWMYFTRHGNFANHDVPMIVRGEGCYV